MGQATVCDGCGISETIRFTAYGITDSRDYCPDCVILVERFLDERDELHERLATEFRDAMQALLHAWSVDRPKGRLPDFRNPQ